MAEQEFNLGDFIEELPYEGGPGSPDEYIANALLIKRLQLRNEELKEKMLAEGKRYLPSTDAKYYIGLSRRNNFDYSKGIEKMEADLKALRAHINAKKKTKEQHGIATEKDPTMVFSVRHMTQEILERINSDNNLLNPEDEDDL